MSFAETCFVFAMDKGNMGKSGHGIFERFIYKDLTGGVVYVVVASDNVGDTHERIVYNYCKVICRRVIAP